MILKQNANLNLYLTLNLKIQNEVVQSIQRQRNFDLSTGAFIKEDAQFPV